MSFAIRCCVARGLAISVSRHPIISAGVSSWTTPGRSTEGDPVNLTERVTGLAESRSRLRLSFIDGNLLLHHAQLPADPGYTGTSTTAFGTVDPAVPATGGTVVVDASAQEIVVNSDCGMGSRSAESSRKPKSSSSAS